VVAAQAGLRRAGGSVVAAVVCIPFFAFAPSRMWQDIVLLQLNRLSEGESLLFRIQLFAFVFVPGRFEPAPFFWFFGAAVVVLLMLWPILAVVARRKRPGTWEDSVWWSSIGLAQIPALVLFPSFYFQYANFAAPAMCLLAGVGVGWLAQRCRKTKRWIIVAVLCIAYGDLVIGTVRWYQNFQADQVARGVSNP